jgi:hypothetical protein
MNTNINLRNLGLSAICAATLAFSLGLGNNAYAADDHNSSRSNKSSSSADEATTEALSETMSEIDTLLSSIQENLARAADLQSQLSEHVSGLDEARAASADSSAEQAQAIEEAQRAFDEHVAPFLDEATVSLVALHFQKIEMDARAIGDPDSDDDGLSDLTEELSSSIAAALSALDSTKSASSELVATYDLKALKK